MYYLLVILTSGFITAQSAQIGFSTENRLTSYEVECLKYINKMLGPDHSIKVDRDTGIITSFIKDKNGKKVAGLVTPKGWVGIKDHQLRCKNKPYNYTHEFITDLIRNISRETDSSKVGFLKGNRHKILQKCRAPSFNGKVAEAVKELSRKMETPPPQPVDR